MRLDLLLVQKKLASSRNHAQELIAAGQVFEILPDGEKRSLSKASLHLDETAKLEVQDGPANRFVSRGGLKLEGALQHLHLSIENFDVLDVGISTGGFSDCLLQKGAASVVGVDVGHGQVNPRLLKNPRLKVLEGVNARYLLREAEISARQYDLIVMDVSFISISLIIPELVTLLKPEGCLLSLVKPQFEVGAEGLGKGGIVKDTALYVQVESRIKEVCQRSGFLVKDYFESAIEGKEGNHEFFIFAQRS